MREKILEFLKKKPEYISGDYISQRLKISRQALWKHIQEIKDSGYDIAAVPHLGYRLVACPDRLFPSEVSFNLNTRFIGNKIFYFDTLFSTMDKAMELGLSGITEGAVVLAETQTKGRGRLGRSWLSPKYKGIYLSLILRPKILPYEASILTLVSAVSVCEAVKEACAIEASIKWPNDIIVNQKKLGGILLELSAEMDRVNFVAVGIGINVNNDQKNLINTATSLREQKKEVISRIDLLKELLRRLEKNYLIFQQAGPRAILDMWREHDVTLGKRVKVLQKNQQIEGVALDIDADGGLLVRKDSGLTVKVMSGDVSNPR